MLAKTVSKVQLNDALGLVVGFVLASLLQIVTAAEMPRTWRAATGKFEVEATLVDRTETQVRLKKTDGQVLTVPVDRLSEADQQYLRSLNAGEAGGKPALATQFPKTSTQIAAAGAVLPETGAGITLKPGEAPAGSAPDPAMHTKPLAEGGFQVDKVDAYDKVTAPLVVDHEGGLVAFSIGRNVITKPEETRGRVYLAKLPKGPAKAVWDVPEALRLWDYHPLADRALLVSRLDHSERGGYLLVLEGLAKGEPKELYRRAIAGKDGKEFDGQIAWAAMLDDQHAAVLVKDQLCVWNLASAAPIYHLEKLRSGVRPALSHGRRYFAVPLQGGAAVVNVVDGKMLGFVACGDLLSPDVAFHPDGKRLSVNASNQLVVFDVQAGAEQTRAVLPNPLGNAPLGWVGKDLLLSDMGDLIRTDLEMSLWHYASLSGSAAARATPGGILLATKNGPCNLVSLRVPHPGSRQAAEQLEKGGNALMLVRPGSPVVLAVEAIEGVERKPIQTALSETVERTGWKVVDRSDTTVVAIIGRGAAQQVQYNTRGPGAAGNPGAVETVSITPFTARLEIRRGGKVLWTRNTVNHPPGAVLLKPGETLQEAVKKYERPDADFFARLQLPPRVPQPEHAHGLGRSTLDGFAWKDLPMVPGKNAKRPGK